MSPNPVLCSKSLLLAFFLFQISISSVSAQSPSQVPARVLHAVDNSQRVELKGNVHPLARQEFDRGAAADAQPMKRILLLLKRAPEQEAALENALENQQDKSSPGYHQWLTPETFGAQYGPADADVQAVTQWLVTQGFTVEKVYSGKTIVEFSGTAAQVRAAFVTDIRNYQITDKSYLANSSNPQIPAALAPVVSGLVSLNNFPVQFFSKSRGVVRKTSGNTPDKISWEPLFTDPSGAFYPLAPGDFATIYNSKGLQVSGNDGTGQTIAIVGETNLNPQDVLDFRTAFALPVNFPASNVILNGEDPGITSQGEETEADLDVQWSGAVAPGATIKYVVSASTAASSGVDLSALYIVEHDFAEVMSESYGACESRMGAAGTAFYKSLWQQAAAQGITVLVSSGDNGSAGCDNFNTQPPAVAKGGLQVNGIASTPYNISVGGTDFDQFNNWTAFWNSTNDPITGASAKGYIPEIPWNENCSQIAITGCSGNPPNGSINLVAASGGPSNIYSKPSWQMGVSGVPNDSHRDLPDVSLFASSGFTGSAYLVCQQDRNGPCYSNNSSSFFLAVGGTSASAPAFAGVTALVNQYQASHGGSKRQGNANYVLYALAKMANASCTSGVAEASTCIFNDVTKGNTNLFGVVGLGTNSVPCQGGTPACSSAVGSLTGVLLDPTKASTEAWTAGAGYDLATGLGSVNINNLVIKWAGASTVSTTTTLTLSPLTGITHGANENVTVNVTVTPKSGTAAGDVSLIAKYSDGTTQGLDNFTLSSGAITNAHTSSLPGGTNYQVYAHYAGDGTNAPSDSAPVTVTVAKETSQTFIVVPLYDAHTGALLSGNASSVPYGSPYRIRIYVTNSASIANPSGPPTPTCDQVNELTCPTGTLTLTANGNGVDRTGGIYNLDDIGYTRDINPTLSAGTFPLVAQYNGDNSYATSTATSSLTVTPAPTVTTTSQNNTLAVVNSNFFISITTQTTSLGIAPSGTYAIFDGTTDISASANISYTPSPGYFPSYAGLQGFAQFSFTTAGIHQLTVKYNGDPNYASSTSVSLAVTVINTSTTSLTASSLNINAGDQITLTATVNTSVKSPALTNNVRFNGNVDGAFPGTISYKNMTDSNGNTSLQATLLVKPTGSELLTAAFNGDANFAASDSGNNPLSLTVVIPDFTVGPNQVNLNVTAGQPASTPLTVTPVTNLTSQVQFTLQNVGSVPGLNCSVTPDPVSLSAQKPSTASFSCSMPAPSATTSTAVVTPWQWPTVGPINKLWIASAFAMLLGILFLLFPARMRFRSLSFASFAIGLAAFIVGCGGGGTGGGGGGGGTTQTPTSITLTVPSTKVPASSSFAATIAVTGTQSPTGTVIISNDSGFLSTGTLVNGQAQIAVTVGGVGTYNFSARYSGDAKNKASQAATIVVIATGTANFISITAATGADTKQIPVTVTIQ
jgi:Pro-kumamolisin, activation domain/Bacterial Ig-like domain (group 3)